MSPAERSLTTPPARLPGNRAFLSVRLAGRHGLRSRMPHRLLCIAFALFLTLGRAAPVAVVPVTAAHGMVVAAHPQAAAIGLEVLKHGGNAIDAAVAVSLGRRRR